MIVEGNAALVAGGASGLGLATVRRLVAGGGRVVVLDCDGERGRAIERECDGLVRFCPGDVRDPIAVGKAVTAAAAAGPLRIGVVCAGTGMAPTRVVQRDATAYALESFRNVVDVNLVGTFNVLRLCAEAMAATAPDESGERGIIVTTASIAAYDGQTGQTAYAASKGGVVSLTLPAARDLAPLGIRVVCVAPGLFDTPLFGQLPDTTRAAIAQAVSYPPRMGEPSEFADLVLHICGNRYLNGEVVRLDGGARLTARADRG